jgi:arylsulfatase A-like enzyme
MVRPETAPAMNELANAGVLFSNSHSVFPTFTMANASAFSTGHYLGDTGVFSNTIYSAFPVPSAALAVTPFLENDAVLGDMDEHFATDFVDEETVLKAARLKGLNTAAIGKVGPTLMQDHTERTGQKTIEIDDATGTSTGIPLAEWVASGLVAQGLPTIAPGRGDNGKPGNSTAAGTTVANFEQQNWFVAAFTDVVLPKFKQDAKPFVAVFWSRDPDGSQHNQGDSLNQLEPGINGPTSLASIRNADTDLAAIRKRLDELGLSSTTDIVVAADHGFSTISKYSKTSYSVQQKFKDVPSGYLPPGFVAIDLAHALNLPILDPNDENTSIGENEHTKAGNAVIGASVANATVIVAANGGSDLVYMIKNDRAYTKTVIDTLLSQDYVSGLFVDERLGHFPGTLPLSAIHMRGSALTPSPSIVVNFRSGSTGCKLPTTCAVEIADTTLQQGQGMHGSFSRGDTKNFIAAIGPDFKQGFVDSAPVSNADVGKTIAAILGLQLKGNGTLVGREITEARRGGVMVKVSRKTIVSDPAENGLRSEVDTQTVNKNVYFDAAGFDGRTAGLHGNYPNF